MKASGGSKTGIRGCWGCCLMASFHLCVHAFASQQVPQVIHSRHIVFYLMTSITPSSVTFTFQTATRRLLINYLAALAHLCAFLILLLIPKRLVFLVCFLSLFGLTSLGCALCVCFKTKQVQMHPRVCMDVYLGAHASTSISPAVHVEPQIVLRCTALEAQRCRSS